MAWLRVELFERIRQDRQAGGRVIAAAWLSTTVSTWAPSVPRTLSTARSRRRRRTLVIRTWAGAALFPTSRSSGGSLILIDQAAQDQISADLPRVEACCSDAGSGTSVRDALVGGLIGPGGTVRLLVLGQDGAQMAIAEYQDPVQER